MAPQWLRYLDEIVVNSTNSTNPGVLSPGLRVESTLINGSVSTAGLPPSVLRLFTFVGFICLTALGILVAKYVRESTFKHERMVPWPLFISLSYLNYDENMEDAVADDVEDVEDVENVEDVAAENYYNDTNEDASPVLPVRTVTNGSKKDKSKNNRMKDENLNENENHMPSSETAISRKDSPEKSEKKQSHEVSNEHKQKIGRGSKIESKEKYSGRNEDRDEKEEWSETRDQSRKKKSSTKRHVEEKVFKKREDSEKWESDAECVEKDIDISRKKDSKEKSNRANREVKSREQWMIEDGKDEKFIDSNEGDENNSNQKEKKSSIAKEISKSVLEDSMDISERQEKSELIKYYGSSETRESDELENVPTADSQLSSDEISDFVRRKRPSTKSNITRFETVPSVGRKGKFEKEEGYASCDDSFQPDEPKIKTMADSGSFFF
mmetsp:Transcript_13222/g.29142  ORF Transcript_13222/g.29142 Transcript_13222/m.29142 type:complete len:439 (-) Transcript_13222:899-2215(-)